MLCLQAPQQKAQASRSQGRGSRSSSSSLATTAGTWSRHALRKAATASATSGHSGSTIHTRIDPTSPGSNMSWSLTPSVTWHSILFRIPPVKARQPSAGPPHCLPQKGRETLPASRGDFAAGQGHGLTSWPGRRVPASAPGGRGAWLPVNGQRPSLGPAQRRGRW